MGCCIQARWGFRLALPSKPVVMRWRGCRATEDRPLGNGASTAGFTERGELTGLLEAAEVVISVCPPHAATALATQVASHDYTGSSGRQCNFSSDLPPNWDHRQRRRRRFCRRWHYRSPATKPGVCRLYLSGAEAHDVESLFTGSFVDARVVADKPGQASALKMAYAAWTKGSDALVLAIRALATREGVDSALVKEWALSQPGLCRSKRRRGGGLGSQRLAVRGRNARDCEHLRRLRFAEWLPRGVSHSLRPAARLQEQDSPRTVGGRGSEGLAEIKPETVYPFRTPVPGLEMNILSPVYF